MQGKFPIGSLKFERAEARSGRLAFTNDAVAWANVLIGKAKTQMFSFFTPNLGKYAPKRDV